MDFHQKWLSDVVEGKEALSPSRAELILEELQQLAKSDSNPYVVHRDLILSGASASSRHLQRFIISMHDQSIVHFDFRKTHYMDSESFAVLEELVWYCHQTGNNCSHFADVVTELLNLDTWR